MRRALAAGVSLLVLFGVAPYASRRAEAGPWLPGRWHLFAQLRLSGSFADARYDANGDRRPLLLVLDASGAAAPTSYRRLETDLFAEVGVATRLSVLVDFHALDYTVQPLGGRADRQALGVSDLWLAGKLLLFDDELTAALQVGFTFPTGSATAAIPLGQGDLRTDFTLLVGKLFEHPDLFVSVELGARLRGHARVTDPRAPGQTVAVDYSHELRYGAEVGFHRATGRRVVPGLWVSAKLEGSYAFGAPVEDGVGVLTPVSGWYVKLGPEISVALGRFLQLSLDGSYFVAGRSMPAFGEIALGLAFRR